jgi:hypothetical protein
MSELQSEPSVRREPLWPAAIVTFGLSLTAAWVILLGYAIIRVVERVI